MLDYEPLSFIGEAITAGFNRPPMLEKKPGCPDFFIWRGDTYRVEKKLAEWSDYARRGRSARNMQPAHAAVASHRGSWGVGRYYFHVLAAGPQVPGSGPRAFELYYDRAPKGSDQRKGQWFLVSELVERSPHAVPETSVMHDLLKGRRAARPPVRLVAFDLDNTLVGPDLTLSARVKAAVARARRAAWRDHRHRPQPGRDGPLSRRAGTDHAADLLSRRARVRLPGAARAARNAPGPGGGAGGGADGRGARLEPAIRNARHDLPAARVAASGRAAGPAARSPIGGAWTICAPTCPRRRTSSS